MGLAGHVRNKAHLVKCFQSLPLQWGQTVPGPEWLQAPPGAQELGRGAVPPYLAWLRPVGSGDWAHVTVRGRDIELTEARGATLGEELRCG